MSMDAEDRHSLPSLSETVVMSTTATSQSCPGVSRNLSAPSLSEPDAKSVDRLRIRRVLPVIDAVMKSPEARDDGDVDAILRAVEYAPAFVCLPPMVRRQLCESLEARVYEEGSTVIHVGDELSFWYILTGTVQEDIQTVDGDHGARRSISFDSKSLDSNATDCEASAVVFSAGDVVGLKIGIDGQLEETGKTVSTSTFTAASPETTLLWLSRDEYVRMACPDNANMRSVEKDGEVVAVTQYRAVGSKQYSQVVVRGTPDKLISFLFHEEGGAMFQEDILLTYRTFCPTAKELLSCVSENASQHPSKVQDFLDMWVTQYSSDLDSPELLAELTSILEKVAASEDGLKLPLLTSLRVFSSNLVSDNTDLVQFLDSSSVSNAPDLHISPCLLSGSTDQLDSMSMLSCENSPYGSRRGSMIDHAEHDTISLVGSPSLERATLGDDSVLRKRNVLSDDSDSSSGSALSNRRRGGSVFRRKKHASANQRAMNTLVPLKIYRADGTSRILACSPDDNITKLVQNAVGAFCTDHPADSFSLVYVTATRPDAVKQVSLPPTMNDLAKLQKPDGRFYLKPHTISGHVASDETTVEIIEQGEVSLLTVELKELVRALTLQDFELFKSVQPVEYIFDLFEMETSSSERRLPKLEDSSNWQMFWVVTEVCREPDINLRANIIKAFIQLAVLCRRCRNFNTMCAVISGLSYAAVSRLKQSWERVPRKLVITFDEMQELLNPSRNMANYRRMLTDEILGQSALPFLPVVKKDLAFIHLGNKSKIDGLVNMDKLRMVANEVRKLSHYRSVQYDSDNMLAGLRPTGSEFVSTTSDSNTLKKAHAALIAKMKISIYLENISVIRDETQLSLMSREIEPPADVTERQNSVEGSSQKHKANVVRNTSLRIGKALKHIKRR